MKRAPFFGNRSFRIASFILFVLLFARPAQAQSLDECMDALLGQMMLEEKIGQMTQVTLAVVAQEGLESYDARLDPQKLRRALVDYNVGSVLNVADHANTVEHWH